MKLNSLLMIGCALVATTACQNQDQQQGNAPECAVMTVQPTSVNLKKNYPTTIKGRQDIEIRPQISGFITKLCVDEGATVRKGQTLFLINPTEYQAAVNTAKAAIEVAEANLATQEITVKSKRELLKKNIISQYDMQMEENTLASMKANLAQSKAQLVTAKQNLSYTVITSPSDGVVGSIPYRVGSLVSASTAEPLTVVSDISKMYAYFSMTEKELLEQSKGKGSTKAIIEQMPELELQLIDGTIYNEKGKVETISGVIDAATGSVSIRAAFANPNGILKSGSTGNVLIPYKSDSAIVIPQKATYEIQDKKFVYILQPDGTVKSTEVGILDISDGQSYIVTSGLKSGDKIALENVSTLKDGQKITPITEQQSKAKYQTALKQEAASAQ